MILNKSSLYLLLALLVTVFSSCNTEKKGSGEEYQGVQLGVITYSWRSMPSTPQEIIGYCKMADISTIELMGYVAEQYAGAPAAEPRPENFKALSEEEKEKFHKRRAEASEAIIQWRVNNASVEKYRELRTLFDEAGIDIHIVKFSPSKWSEEEIDYAFESAKILGAGGVSNEIGHEACKRLGPIAEKHGMYAIFHNHGQPGDTAFHFEDFLAYSPANMLNLDVGHYFGASGKHPNELIEKLHERIYSIHLKDKTAKDGNPPDTNKAWGEGDTPLEDILLLIRDKQWDIYCDVELEYPLPEGSDAVKETARCVRYCRGLLE